MWCGVECGEFKEFQLYFYVESGDEDYSISDNLALDGDWAPVDAENYRATVPGLCPIKAEKADLSRISSVDA
jgi:hypothetical protein